MTAEGARWHLVRRAVGSLSNATPSSDDLAVARSVLSEAEYALWCRMDGRDQRHSLVVLVRFDALIHGAPREWRAAALLHDVGKTASSLGWVMRVCATLLGRRGARFSTYHDHERIGVEMLTGISDPATIALLSDEGDPAAVAALRRADDI